MEMQEPLLMEDAFSRCARHGRLYQLYQSLGDHALALAHWEEFRRHLPADPVQAEEWSRLLAPAAPRV
jgi:hypothetical protein